MTSTVLELGVLKSTYYARIDVPKNHRLVSLMLEFETNTNKPVKWRPCAEYSLVSPTELSYADDEKYVVRTLYGTANLGVVDQSQITVEKSATRLKVRTPVWVGRIGNIRKYQLRLTHQPYCSIVAGSVIGVQVTTKARLIYQTREMHFLEESEDQFYEAAGTSNRDTLISLCSNKVAETNRLILLTPHPIKQAQLLVNNQLRQTFHLWRHRQTANLYCYELKLDQPLSPLHIDRLYLNVQPNGAIAPDTRLDAMVYVVGKTFHPPSLL